jgi:REP element-mobilizing transposase RayT
MAGGYKIYNQHALHFITFLVVDWIDALTRKRYRDIVIDSLKYCQAEKELSILAYCLMPSHVHMVSVANGTIGLSAILGDFKKFTANKILGSIKHQLESRRTWMLNHFAWRGRINSNNTNYQFWQQGNHPIELDSHHIIQQKIDYIHQNPVKADWVIKPRGLYL